MATRKKKAIKKAQVKSNPQTGEASGELTSDRIDSILKSVHRVLRNKDVTQPIKLEIAASGEKLCWKWESETLDNGRVRWHWVQRPC